MKQHHVHRPKIGWARSLLRAWFRGDDGVSAVEFALFAPILFFALLATADLGLALYQRMTIDHVLRAAAQGAMADRGEASVLQVLESTATKNFTLASETSTAGDGTLALSAERYFACPEDPGTAVASSTICSGNASPYIYYRLSGSKSYDGLFLPISVGQFSLGSFRLTSSAQVQIR